jgi:hypothetical protein
MGTARPDVAGSHVVPGSVSVLCTACAVRPRRRTVHGCRGGTLCSSPDGVRDPLSMEMALANGLAVARDQWMPVVGCLVVEVGRQWT